MEGCGSGLNCPVNWIPMAVIEHVAEQRHLAAFDKPVYALPHFRRHPVEKIPQIVAYVGHGRTSCAG